MQCITVLVTVIATASLTSEGVLAKPSVYVKTVDVKSLLQSLKALQQDREPQQDRYGSLNNQRNVQPYSLNKQSVGNRQQYYDRYTKQRKQRYDDRKPLFNDRVDVRGESSPEDNEDREEALKLLDRKRQQQNSNSKSKLFNERALQDLLNPNNRMRYQKPSSLLNNGDGDTLNLDKYARIYVVLNPQALKQEKDVADLVSQFARERPDDDDVRQYNGFSVNNQLLRRAIGRDEVFDEPKRPRGRDGGYGGGGGAGGRTAIPYLKHRGDIYGREE